MNDIVQAPQKKKLMEKIGDQFGVEPKVLMKTLKDTAFSQGQGKAQPTDEQMVALMVVADQYGLNPFTKEVYAFPDKNNGIVPVVGVDGWSRIINSHPQFNGMRFEQDASNESCTCIIHRKDREYPVEVTEWFVECNRPTGPWKSHPRRMLRHKAMIQCARLAFGFAGIYDPDEADRIQEAEKDITPAKSEPQQLPACDDAQVTKHLPEVQNGNMKPETVINMLSAKYTLTQDQIELINKAAPIEGEVQHEDS